MTVVKCVFNCLFHLPSSTWFDVVRLSLVHSLTADHLCLDSAVVVVSTCTVSTSGPLLSCLVRTCSSSPPKSGPPVFSLAGHVGGTWRRMRAMRLVLLHRASRDSQPYACEACGCFLALYERDFWHGFACRARPACRGPAKDDLSLYYHLVTGFYFEGTSDLMPGRRSTRNRTCVLRPVPPQIKIRCGGAGAHVSARVSCAQYPLRVPPQAAIAKAEQVHT